MPVFLEVAHQCIPVRAALGALAQAVDFQAHVTHAQRLPQAVRQQDQFGIDMRAGKCIGRR